MHAFGTLISVPTVLVVAGVPEEAHINQSLVAFFFQDCLDFLFALLISTWSGYE